MTTKEQIECGLEESYMIAAVEIVGVCTCSPSYVAIKRGTGHRPDPNCDFCLLAEEVAEALSQAHAAGVREGIEMAARIADHKANEQNEILRNPPHRMCNLMDRTAFSRRDLWERHADEIRALIKE